MSIERGHDIWCGGAIIDKNWIITVGRRCGQISVGNLKVRAGTSMREKGGSVHHVDRIMKHPRFCEVEHSEPENDIALMRVVEPFEFDETRQPIKLPEAPDQTLLGKTANLTGFGVTRDGEYPKYLQSIEIPVIELHRCNKTYEVFFGIKLPEHGFVCAGHGDDVGGRNACWFDEGDPLAVDGRLVGIVSWVLYCIKPNSPVLYTDIGYYREWIDEQLKSPDQPVPKVVKKID